MKDLENIFLKKTSYKISLDEGFRGNIYIDHKGFKTIGFGFNLDTNYLPEEVGRFWLQTIVNKIESDLSGHFIFWHYLNDASKYVLINMTYQLGLNGLLKFKNFLDSLADKNIDKAALDLKDSQWYRDFTSRATRLINILKSGEF